MRYILNGHADTALTVQLAIRETALDGRKERISDMPSRDPF